MLSHPAKVLLKVFEFCLWSVWHTVYTKLHAHVIYNYFFRHGNQSSNQSQSGSGYPQPIPSSGAGSSSTRDWNQRHERSMGQNYQRSNYNNKGSDSYQRGMLYFPLFKNF